MIREKCARVLLGLVAIAMTSTVSAAPADLQLELDRFSSAPESNGVSVSALFLPMEGDLEETVQFQADRVIVPASVTKLVTSFVALRELGPDHTFETRVSYQGNLDDRGVLSGNLIIEGTGDPFFVSERMWLLANQLRQTGIAKVEGDLVFERVGFSWADPTRDRAAGGSNRAYAALPSQLAINFNSVAVRITPGERAGDAVKISEDPFASSYLEFDNQLTTGAAGSKPDWHFEMATTAPGIALASQVDQRNIRWLSNSEPLERAQLRGRIPVGTRPFVAYRRVRFPLARYGSLFRAFLEEVGIEVSGTVIIDSAPGARTLLTRFESPPLQDLLVSMNRYSNNFIANQLALAVHFKVAGEGAAQSKDELVRSPNEANLEPSAGATVLAARPAHLAEAGTTLAQWLVTHVEASPDVTLEDGSGLSPNNRLNADALVKLLAAGWNDFSILPKLMFGLPGPRGIGTLKQRFGGKASPPDLWAKTGTFQEDRVCSLAGYVDSPRGPVAFAILMDGEAGSRWNVRRMQMMQEYWIDLYLKGVR